MTGGTRETPVNSSPAVAANAEGEEIEVLESTDVLPVAPEDVSLHTITKCPHEHTVSPFHIFFFFLNFNVFIFTITQLHPPLALEEIQAVLLSLRGRLSG